MINRTIVTLKEKAVLALALTAASAFAFVPWYTILVKVYRWHLVQPEVVEGGIELGGVYLLWLLAARFIRWPGRGAAAISLVAALYLQRHAMLLSCIAAWLYLETLIACGQCVLRKLGILVSPGGVLLGHVQAFVVGVAGWTLLALVLSALNFGTPYHLRLLTLFLGFAVLVIDNVTPITKSIYDTYRKLTFVERSLALGLALLVLVQCGKAPLAIDYDSMWYGLRPEKVLFGAGGLFDELRLTHFVYYYPKQFELLFGPLSGLNEYAFIQAGNIGLLALSCVVVVLLFLDQGLHGQEAFFWTLLVISVPCFSNMASTAKPDTLSVLAALLVALFGLRFIRTHRVFELGLMVAAIALLLGAKLTAVAYVPALLVGLVAAFIMTARPERRDMSYGKWLQLEFDENPPSARRAAWAVALLGFGSYLILLVRTWRLTGIPTLPVGIELWKGFGLEARYPWSYMMPDLFIRTHPNLTDQITLWMRMLFDPSQYAHYVMAWPGNASVYFGILLISLVMSRAIRLKPVLPIIAFFTPVLLTSVAVTFVVSRHGDGSIDGNYFLIPVSFGIIAAGIILSRISETWTRRAIRFVGVLFIVSHLPIMFVSHWSWHAGTSAFQPDLEHWVPGVQEQDKADFRAAGVIEIEAYALKYHRFGLCVGLSRNGKLGSESILRRLPCRFEDFEQLMGRMFELFRTEERFDEYLSWAQPDLFVMPRSELVSTAPLSSAIRAAFDRLSRAPCVTSIESPEYVALDLWACWHGTSGTLGGPMGEDKEPR